MIWQISKKKNLEIENAPSKLKLQIYMTLKYIKRLQGLFKTRSKLPRNLTLALQVFVELKPESVQNRALFYFI